MNIEQWPTSRLKPYERNARKIPQAAIDAVAQSIAEFGFQQPVVVDQHGCIIVGHTRHAAAEQLGLEEVPVLIASSLTPAQVRAYRIADNKAHEFTSWDLDTLKLELEGLNELDDPIENTLLSASELNKLLDLEPASADDDAELEEDEEVRDVHRVSRDGDVWVLTHESGLEHRMYIGDAFMLPWLDAPGEESSGSDVHRPDIELVMTDIPYGEVDQGSGGLRQLDRGDADRIEQELDQLWSMLDQGARSFYVFCGTMQVSGLIARMRSSGCTSRLGVYSKTDPSPMNGDKMWLSGLEVCAFGRRENATFNEHCRKALWEAPSGSSGLHPTQKPVALFKRLVRASTRRGHTVLDPFLGSGTTLIACASIGRACIGVERNPLYGDIALSRWAALYEREPVLQATGQTMSEVELERSQARTGGAQESAPPE